MSRRTPTPAGVNGDGQGWGAGGAWGGLDEVEVEAIAEAWTDVVLLRCQQVEPGVWAEHAAASRAWQWGRTGTTSTKGGWRWTTRGCVRRGVHTTRWTRRWMPLSEERT